MYTVHVSQGKAERLVGQELTSDVRRNQIRRDDKRNDFAQDLSVWWTSGQKYLRIIVFSSRGRSFTSLVREIYLNK